MSQTESKTTGIYDFYKKLDHLRFLEIKNMTEPSLVYKMTLKLELNKDAKVLEVGTGSGYQTAFLAEFAGEVYSVENIEELSKKAQEKLGEMGYKNIRFKIGNGSEGWKEFAPYDRIMVTAAVGKLPDPLVEQLKPGGIMIIPVGERRQELLLIRKDSDGKVTRETLGDVIFVELKGKYGRQNKDGE